MWGHVSLTTADIPPVTEKARAGGKRATPPGHVKVFKTAVFKIHKSSKRKRAMLADSMTRCHLAYERLLIRFMPPQSEIARLGKMSKRERREALRPSTSTTPPLGKPERLIGRFAEMETA